MITPQTRLALFLIFGAIILAYVWFFGPLRYFPGPSPAATERNLRARLPVGTHTTQVLAYLDSEHIEHSPDMHADRTILAIRRNTCHMFLVECDTEVKIVFDQESRLTSVEVKPGFTGL